MAVNLETCSRKVRTQELPPSGLLFVPNVPKYPRATRDTCLLRSEPAIEDRGPLRGVSPHRTGGHGYTGVSHWLLEQSLRGNNEGIPLLGEIIQNYHIPHHGAR